MKKLEKKLGGLTNIDEIIRTIKKFSNDPEFKKYANKEAKKLVTNLFVDGGRTWREAARKSTQGRMIYERLKRELNGPLNGSISFEIQKNAEIIKSIPINISKEVTEHILTESMAGRRASSIAEDLQELIPKMTKNKAKLIARTETSKTSTALTKARCENLGINWYIWRTSEDVRVRSSHSHMEDVLVCWNNPPSPEALINEKFVGVYHAGDIYNCRCYPEPVIKLDFIKWPHKVYANNKIIVMTRKQFELIM